MFFFNWQNSCSQEIDSKQLCQRLQGYKVRKYICIVRHSPGTNFHDYSRHFFRHQVPLQRLGAHKRLHTSPYQWSIFPPAVIMSVVLLGIMAGEARNKALVIL